MTVHKHYVIHQLRQTVTNSRHVLKLEQTLSCTKAQAPTLLRPYQSMNLEALEFINLPASPSLTNSKLLPQPQDIDLHHGEWQ
jgi:hypothetical protein